MPVREEAGYWVVVNPDGDVLREGGIALRFPTEATARAADAPRKPPHGASGGPRRLLYVSGYTPLYEPYAKRLEATLHALGTHYELTAYSERGSWLQNLSVKPDTVLSGFASQRYPDHDVVWLDADCLLQNIWPQDTEADVIYFVNLPASPRRFDFETLTVMNNTGCLITPAGMAIYFRNVPEVRQLVETWRDLCYTFGNVTNDEQCFREALHRHPGLSLLEYHRDRGAIAHGAEGYKGGRKPPGGGVI